MEHQLDTSQIHRFYVHTTARSSIATEQTSLLRCSHPTRGDVMSPLCRHKNTYVKLHSALIDRSVISVTLKVYDVRRSPRLLVCVRVCAVRSVNITYDCRIQPLITNSKKDAWSKPHRKLNNLSCTFRVRPNSLGVCTSKHMCVYGKPITQFLPNWTFCHIVVRIIPLRNDRRSLPLSKWHKKN